jgi:hypothetical protein
MRALLALAAASRADSVILRMEMLGRVSHTGDGCSCVIGSENPEEYLLCLRDRIKGVAVSLPWDSPRDLHRP